MSDPITIDRKLKAMAEEADALGCATQLSVALDHQRKARRAEVFKGATGTAKDREMLAESDTEYLSICDAQATAAGDVARLKARHQIGLAWVSYQQTLARLERQT